MSLKSEIFEQPLVLAHLLEDQMAALQRMSTLVVGPGIGCRHPILAL